MSVFCLLNVYFSGFNYRLDDQDYLQFSLRITEDIIRNDLYTYKDMKQIFKSHINANMDKLDMVSCFLSVSRF